jgi:acyl-CoA hydrolase
MAEGQSLAQYTATFFAMGNPIVPLGIDEAIFLQPVALGDMVTFTARLVHATATTCRVNVTVEVRDPAAPSQVPVRSNRLVFVFGGDFSNRPEVIPETYQEILMHVDAQRRHVVEGPWDDEVQVILKEMEKG